MERGGHVYPTCISFKSRGCLFASSDACLHHLMLSMPCRVDTDAWLEETGHGTYKSLAESWFGKKRLAELIPGILDSDPCIILEVNSGAENDDGEDEEVAQSIEMVELTEEQSSTIDKILEPKGPHLVTGPAGSGKSTILKELVQILRNGNRFEPIVLAPSAIAALNVGGQTIQSYFGLARSDDVAFRSAYTLDWKLHRLQHEQNKEPFFILDEASMVSRKLFEGLSEIFGKVFEKDGAQQPFGGQRLVLFADFGQLGPVMPLDQHDQTESHDQWLFQSDLLKKFIRTNLTESQRQKSDKDFYHFLTIVRRGPADMDEERLVETTLRTRLKPQLQDVLKFILDGSIFITATRNVASTMNHSVLKMIGKEQDWPFIIFNAEDTAQGPMNEWRQGRFERETGLDTVLAIRVAAQVMVTVNIDQKNGIVNGAMGIVEGVDDEEGTISVRMRANGKLVQLTRISIQIGDGGRCRRQFPLILAYALTVHRVQSLTLESAVVDLQGLFCTGQAYVALSRVRALDKMWIYRMPEDIGHLFPKAVVFSAL